MKKDTHDLLHKVCTHPKTRLEKENCSTCVLRGYGKDKFERPNYAAWLLVYIEAGKQAPEKAILKELQEAQRKNPAYYQNILQTAQEFNYSLPSLARGL